MTALHHVGVLLLVSLCSGTILRQVLFDDYSETGAVCLDGSPAGYYIREATSVGAANNWQLDFQGGGWCYEEADCEARSHIYLGTSTVWQSNVSMYASLSDDPAVNPDFYDWNLVWLPYCDGASFSGYLEEPIEYNGTKLYFRGRTILDQVFSHLKRDHNFGNAENVLLTGCSAGGLATFFHADYVQSLLPPSVQIYKSLPMCGFFLDHTNINGKPVYSSQMEYVFQMQNCSAGVNQRCLQAAKEGEEWRCIFAVNNYAHTTIPTFVVNSAVDLWQIGCILLSWPMPPESPYNGFCFVYPEWQNCTLTDIAMCTPSQVQVMNEYSNTFTNTLDSIKTLYEPGNGAFISSCLSHCTEDYDRAWTSLSIDGVTLQQAVSKWWHSSKDTPASDNTYKPCLYTEDPPVECNPTCVEGWTE